MCHKKTPTFGYELFDKMPPKEEWIERKAFLCNNCSLMNNMFDFLEMEHVEDGYCKYTNKLY